MVVDGAELSISCQAESENNCEIVGIWVRWRVQAEVLRLDGVRCGQEAEATPAEVETCRNVSRAEVESLGEDIP